MSSSLIDDIKKEEGLQLKVYTCPANKLTIGYGRNVEDRGITKEEAEYLLLNDVADVKLHLVDKLPYWENLSINTQEVLIHMGFQMGVNGLLKFKKTLSYIKDGELEKASKEMLDSSWYKQTPKRAIRLSKKLIQG